MSDNRRSKTVTQGVQRSPHRPLLRAVGLGDREFQQTHHRRGEPGRADGLKPLYFLYTI